MLKLVTLGIVAGVLMLSGCSDFTGPGEIDAVRQGVEQPQRVAKKVHPSQSDSTRTVSGDFNN